MNIFGMLSPLENLRAFAISRPPLVVFTICLTAFAIATLFLAYYLQMEPIKDPDIIDWNDVMDKMSLMDLCVRSWDRSIVAPPRKQFSFGWWDVKSDREEERALRAYLRDTSGYSSSSSTKKSVSLPFQVHLGEDGVRKLVDNRIDILWGTVSLRDLSSKHDKSTSKLGVSLDFGPKQRLMNCTPGGYCTITPSVCITFRGPTELLPSTLREGKSCVHRDPTVDDAARFVAVNEDTSDESCSGIVIRMEYVHDPAYTETINYSDKVLIHMHLTYTSYFLFVTVMTVLCCAIVKGNKTKSKTASLEKNVANV